MKCCVALFLSVFPALAGGHVMASSLSCLNPMTETAKAPDQKRIARIFEEIQPALGVVFQHARSSEYVVPTVCFADNPDAALGVFDGVLGTILLRRDMDDGMAQGVLLHELRHADQFRRGFCPSNDISMEANARAVAAMEADASAMSLLAAWRLDASGRPNTWDALKGWSQQSDIAARFDDEMSHSGNATTAVTLAFAQWYERESRWRSYYISSCSDFLDRQDEGHLLPSYKALPDGFLDTLCVLPNDGRYPCEDDQWNPRLR